MKQNRLTEIGVAAITSLALIAVYLVARAYLGDASDGDWLNFAGAVFGFMGAILVAIWIPNIQSRSRDEIARTRILEAAADLIDTLDFSDVPTMEQAEGRWERVLIGLERMTFERENLSQISHDEYFRMRGIERAIQKMDDQIRQNVAVLDPLAFEHTLGVDRDATVHWLRQLEEMLSSG